MGLAKTRTSLLIVSLATTLAIGIAYLTGGRADGVTGIPPLVLCAVLALGLQWIAFVPAYKLQTEKFYDLVGSLTYMSVVGLAFGLSVAAERLDLRTAMLAALISVWTVRLGLFLGRRVHRAGKDARFDQLKPSWHRFLVAWTLQGLWVFLTSLAALVLLSSQRAAPLVVWDVIGLALWLLGFGLEVIADRQKARFSAQPSNRGRFINVGLWAWSRHPNYAGEIILWIGIFVVGVPHYRGAEWLSVLSPLFVWVLLRFGSGVPLLEQRADERWGGQPEYERYKAATPILWPWPPRR